MNKRWICSDVWMDILPSFNHAQLGLKMALLSDRFDILVDKHFDGKSELRIWRMIKIEKDEGPKAKFSVRVDDKWVAFPMPDRPLPNKIRFNHIRIKYIDHSVLAFLHANKQIWDRSGTNLELFIWSNKTADDQPIWDVFVHEIWPIFVTNIRQLGFASGDALDNLHRRTSPTILTDLDQLNSINSGSLLPDGIADDGPNATAGQALSKWLHTPTKNGQPKRLHRNNILGPLNIGWVNNLKETFRRATTSSFVNYTVQFTLSSSRIVPFELVNERTNEKLTLKKQRYNHWLLKRCPISVGETAATNQWENVENLDANLNNVQFHFWDGSNYIGPLSPSAEEEKEEADQNNAN